MLAAKNYQGAMFILRQLEFGLFDFRLHAEFSPEQGAKILETLAEIKKQVAVIPGPTWDASRTRSAISSQAGTPQATTATCGPTRWWRKCLLALRRRGDFQPRNRSGLPRQHPDAAAAVQKSLWSCSNASVAASRSWMRCWRSITESKADCYVKIC
uniref:M3 family metallopeptidase n=1 Tax=Enterobacter cloacae complex sp. 280C5 TaxID=3395861 RepID=UPI003CEC5D18